MKETKKAFASLAIAGMTLGMLPYNVFAEDTVPIRLAGITAAQTAVAIADQTGWTGTAVLASSASFGLVDALTAGPLATFLKAPILLQEPGRTLNSDTKAELTKLNVKTVYVTSGTAVISQEVLDQLAGMGITIVPLGGADRFETAVNIAKKMIELGSPVSKVAVAYGWANQDALSIAPIASASNQPILLTEKISVPASVRAFLSANPDVTSSDVIGGTGVISDAVKAVFPNATRHSGDTAYETNKQIIQDFASSLEFNNVYVANGKTAIDALIGAPLAARTKSAIVLTDGTVPAVNTFVQSKLNASGVVTALGGSVVVPVAVHTAMQNFTPIPAESNVTPPLEQSNLAVTSVSTISASSFKVVFNQAPTDTSKLTFEVRYPIPVDVTTEWNSDKTEATLTAVSNLPSGAYSVAVKNDTTDLGISTLEVTQQKIAKIDITSTKLAIISDPGYAYATYQVLDQYGNDITTSYLANSLTFQSGVGTVAAKHGLLTIVPSDNLKIIQFSTVTITGYDSASGISTNATLSTSTALGTLSNITLETLTNAENKVLTDGDYSSTWYIDYTASDISGNATKDYSLVKNGLILNTYNGNKNCLTTSSTYVQAQVVQDPNDSNKAAIAVTVLGNNGIYIDLPVSITALTYNGTSSTLNLTLKKAASVDTFIIKPPTSAITISETKKIPFEAYDQNGAALIKYSDFSGVTFNGATLSSNVYGMAVLKNNPQTFEGPEVITALTPTGKYSSTTINIQKAAHAETLALGNSDFARPMLAGTIQKADFGYDWGGLSVKDQYGRIMDMTNGADVYNVQAVSSDNSIVSVTGVAKTGRNQIKITALAPGTATITFKLVSNVNPDIVIDSKSETFSVINNSDIKGYTIDTVSTMYANTDLSNITERDREYNANPAVYGTTANGTKVKLIDPPIKGATVDNSRDFAVVGTVGAYDSVKVYALKLPDNATESTTNLTVTLLGLDGNVHSVNTPIKSSTALPVAYDIDINVEATSFRDGVSISPDDEDTLIVSVASGALAPNKVMAIFDTAGSSANRAGVYFYANDQYGSGMKLAQIVKNASGSSLTDDQFYVNSDGTITGTGAVAGGTVTLTAITTNGLIKIIKVIFIQ